MFSGSEESREVARAVGWIRRIAKGDRKALRHLYEAYHQALLRFSIRILGDQGDAEEVVQDVFLKAWHLSHRYDPELSQPLSWLFMMTRSQAIDRLRKRINSLKSVSIGEQNQEFPPLISEEAMQTFNHMVNVEWVDRLLGGLPECQRRCLELTVFDGYTQAEVANRLNRPLGTIKSEIRRGLARLRAVLEKEAI